MDRIMDHTLLKTAGKTDNFGSLETHKQHRPITVKGTEDIRNLAADKIIHESLFSAFLQNYTQKNLSKFFLYSRIINLSDYKHQDSRHSIVLTLVKITKIPNIEAENPITTRNKKQGSDAKII